MITEDQSELKYRLNGVISRIVFQFSIRGIIILQTSFQRSFAAVILIAGPLIIKGVSDDFPHLLILNGVRPNDHEDRVYVG